MFKTTCLIVGTYVGGAFIEWRFNPGEWDGLTRFTGVMVIAYTLAMWHWFKK